MKQYCIFILIFTLLLCGCQNQPTSTLPNESSDFSSELSDSNVSESESLESETQESSTLESTVQESETDQVPLAILLDQAQPLDTTGSLFYIPNEWIEEKNYPSIMEFRGDFLISTQHFEGEDEEAVTCTTTLRSIDSNTGLLKKELVFSEIGFITVRICSDTLVLANLPGGNIYFLDENLEIISQYSFTTENPYNPFYLSPDLTTLYQLDWNLNCIIAIDLASNTTSSVLENVYNIFVANSTDHYLTVSYVDPLTYKEVVASFNLQSGQLEHPPFAGNFSMFSRVDDIWLASLSSDLTTYFLGNSETPTVFSYNDGSFTLDPQNRFIICQASDAQSLSLYSLDGTHLSSCGLHTDSSEEISTTFWESEFDYYYIYANSLMWSDTYGGYFLIATGNTCSKLLFWDINAPSTGEPLTSMTVEEWNGITTPMGNVAPAELYNRAQSLSDQYGVQILIADQCDATFSDFNATLVYDAQQISHGLDVLETALSAYPENFFKQLQYGSIEYLEIQLVGELHSLGAFDTSTSYAGFADTIDSKHLIVVDINQTYPTTYYHEFSHIIDKKLAFASLYKEDALFSEMKWLSLCPEGFAYLNSYTNIPTTYLAAGYETYFIDPYSQINATEDRARVFEFSMQGLNLAFLQYPGLQQKLLYYSQCIRQCFDTTSWPETTLWEKTLVDCGLWP